MEGTINLRLSEQLRMLRLNALQLDRHFLPSGHVRPQIDIPKAPRPNLAAEAVFLPHTQLVLHACSTNHCLRSETHTRDTEVNVQLLPADST